MLSPSLLKEFGRIVGRENILVREADRQAYSYDAAVSPPEIPALAVRPGGVEDLGRIAALCSENELPLTVRGAGTNLSGGTIPAPGGVVVLTNGLDKILEINEADLYAVVEPGVVTARFAAEAAERGLFYPPDPGSQAVSTLGGNVAENAGGLRGLKYGVTRDYVMGLEFYDATGGLVRSGSRTVKCVAGYNLSSFLVGSEGTLGIISKIILKLIPPPRASRAMTAEFADMDAASEAVAAIIAEKIVPCTLEFLDNATIRHVEAYTGAGLPVEAGALLLIEVDGHPAQCEEDAARAAAVCREHGATRTRAAENEEERDRLWEARRNALPALARARPTTVLEDATVPRSRIPEMIRGISAAAAEFRVDIGVFGHAGDGNLHPTILCDRRDKKEFERVELAVDAIFDTALSLQGTLSGEHGIGLAKAKWLERETGRPTLEYCRRLKRAADPAGVLNPGKILGF